MLAMASAASAATPEPTILRVEDIRPGMKGYGLSVFQGTEPERFPVEVVDVLHGFRPNQELILVRTPHALLDRARTVAGMSGSPIYIDGKFVGAYAYGFTFPADPVVGVTPAAPMLEEMKRPVTSRPPALTVEPRVPPRPVRKAQAIPLQFGEDGALPDALAALRAFESSSAMPRGDGRLVPVATPLMLGGFTDGATELVESIFEKHGYVPLQAGGGSGARAGAPGRFVDGGAISVTLIRGDMSISAVGTVTHVGPKGRVIAFGHPMMNQGEVFFPTALAHVLHVFVSLQRSFKIAEPTRPLGTLVHDRQSAIVIDMNEAATTVPMRIGIAGIPGAPKTDWNVELVSHRFLTAPLAFAALSNAIQATASDRIPVRVRARTVLHLEGREPIELVDETALSQGAGMTAPLRSLRTFALLEAAYANPFGPERPTRIEVDLAFTLGERPQRIVGLSTPRTQVEPGSTIPVDVRVARYDGTDRTHRVMVKIPAHLAGKKTTLVASPAGDVPRAFARPRRFEDLVRYVDEARPPTSVGLSLTLPSRGLRFDGHVVERLPASALAALQSVSSTDASAPFESHAETFMPVDAVLEGKAELELLVSESRR
jgi:hypothetical protein